MGKMRYTEALRKLFEVMEDEVKLSNSEIEGQLEIPGIKKVRNR